MLKMAPGASKLSASAQRVRVADWPISRDAASPGLRCFSRDQFQLSGNRECPKMRPAAPASRAVVAMNSVSQGSRRFPVAARLAHKEGPMAMCHRSSVCARKRIGGEEHLGSATSR